MGSVYFRVLHVSTSEEEEASEFHKSSIIQEATDYPNVFIGLEAMVRYWKGNKMDIIDGRNHRSIQFEYKRNHHAFRVETPSRGRQPRLVIYSGNNDPQRGSPLIKEADQKGLLALKDSFGFNDTGPDWTRDLAEDGEIQFYNAFVEHAFRMCHH